jgi:hypothetical protein
LTRVSETHCSLFICISLCLLSFTMVVSWNSHFYIFYSISSYILS